MRRQAKMPNSPSSDTRSGHAHENTFRDPSTRRWQLGTVLSYNQKYQSYVVRTQMNGERRNVPRLSRDPGENSVLPPETIVALHDELGFLVIDSVLKLAPLNATEVAPQRITDARGIGGEDPVFQGNTSDTNYRPPNDPIDILVGDWMRQSPAGNHVGVLDGGTNVLYSSPFAQLRTNQVGDLVEMFAYAYRHISSMGNVEVKNDGGKTSLVWRAGSDQGGENGAQTENWTIRLDAGAEGDLFDLRITTPDGNTLSQFHMSADGKLSIVGINGIDTTTTGDQQEDIGGDHRTTVLGDQSNDVNGSVELSVGGNENHTVSKTLTMTVGGNDSRTVNGDVQCFISGDTTEKHLGAYKAEVVNGGVEIALGNPVSGALPTGQAFNWVNYTGPYNFVVQPTAAAGAGAFNVLSSLPKSVNLGADGVAVYNPATGTHVVTMVPPIFSAAKFEPLLQVLTAMLTWMDAHTHLSAMGPTLPGAASPTTGPVTPLVAAMLPLIQSLRVAIGL